MPATWSSGLDALRALRFRAYFGRSAYPREEIVERLDELSGLVEWSSAKLLAVDAQDLSQARPIADSCRNGRTSAG